MVALNTSRGFESASSKLLMRLSVLAADFLVLLPASTLHVVCSA